MKWSFYAMIIGFFMDLILGDPRNIPHPVIGIGKLILFLENKFRRIFPKTRLGENMAGACLWILTVSIPTILSGLILLLCHRVSPWIRLIVESIMCWQILALKSLRDESMKVYDALKSGDLQKSRYAVSMIVGRDTQSLDESAITRATVETIAENTSDGIIAPLFFIAIGGAPMGFFYKAVNTMDSMLGYVEPPYKNIGLVPAKADDIMNFLPSRISAILMLSAGVILKLDVKNGWKIFWRDRFNHASPNSAQTESVCAGLLQIRLAGDAWYHGVLHKKKFIGDSLREIAIDDIILACRLLYGTSLIAVILLSTIKFMLI